MALSSRDRARYARHLLLSQLGEAGQERLLAASVHKATDADDGAWQTAQSYLERAGVSIRQDAGVEVALPTSAALRESAGIPELAEAARALAGALAAVRTIQSLAGIPASPVSTSSFSISSEDV